MTFLTYLSKKLTGMAALSEDCLNKLNKSELVALISGLQNKMDSLKSFFLLRNQESKWKFSQLKSNILGTKMVINCYPSSSAIWIGKPSALQEFLLQLVLSLTEIRIHIMLKVSWFILMRDKMLLLTSRALFVMHFLKAGFEVIPSNIEVSVLAIGKKQL